MYSEIHLPTFLPTYTHTRGFKHFKHKTDIKILLKITKLFWTISLN